MTKAERAKLIVALNHLEANPCEWEDAMQILYNLAGFQYHDHRIDSKKASEAGNVISIWELASNAMNKEN